MQPFPYLYKIICRRVFKKYEVIWSFYLKKQEVGEDLSVCMLNLQVVYVLNVLPEVTGLVAS